MKKTFVSIVLLLSCSLFVSAADIYVNNSGQSGTYTSITSALAAAAPGDRIFVSPYGDYTENLTISQSVTLACAVSGTSFNVVGTLTINGAPNMDVKVVGGNFSSSCIANTGGTSLNDMADVYLIESKFSNITGNDFIRMHVLFCEGNATIRHGEVRGCVMSTISIADGPNAGIGDTVFIVGNKARIYWNNDDNYFFIANNNINISSNYCLKIQRWLYNSSVNNHILNNTMSTSTNSGSFYPITISAYNNNLPSSNSLDNIYVYNNIIENRWSSTSNNAAFVGSVSGTSHISGSIKLYYNMIRSSPYANGFSLVTGNTFGQSSANVEALILAEDGSCDDAEYCIDKGSPSLQYYDIDMTRNDRGSYGGPYSIDNYLEVGTGNARIYDLDMPFEIWPGQTPQVNAKAAHTK